MADNKNLTVFQKLFYLFGNGAGPKTNITSSKYALNDKDLIVTKSKESYEKEKLQLQQQNYLNSQWARIDNELYQKAVYYETSRLASYMDFESMEFTPEISAALDILSEESCTINEQGKVLSVYSNSERIKKVLEDLFYHILDIHSNLPMWIRNTCKYGDNFVFLKIDHKNGIVGANQLTNIEIERKEIGLFPTTDTKDLQQNAKKQVQFLWREKNLEFNSWEIAHFRLLGDDRKLPYGTSVLEKVRRIWKLLLLAEDAMLVYRVTRAPERRVFKIYVGNIDDADVEAYVQKVANKFKRSVTADSQTGQQDIRYNTLAVDQDFFIPVRDVNASMPIETLPGACLDLNTRIPLLDGRVLPLSEIIEEHTNGNELWAYSINPHDGSVLPGLITWAGITRKDTDVLKITLDNGNEIICTPDHKFPTKDRGKLEAKDLHIGDSLFSFNTTKKKINSTSSDYEMVYDHKLNDFVYTHRMVANSLRSNDVITETVDNPNYNDSIKNTIHHINFNRFNNSPSNLTFMNGADHRLYHSKTLKEFAKLGGQALSKKMKTDHEFRKQFIENVSKTSKMFWDNLTDSERTEIKNKQIAGIKNYIENLTNEGKKIRAEISKKNWLVGYENLKNKMNSDPEFKKNVYDKVSFKNKITKNTEEYKQKASINSKLLFLDDNYRKKVFEPQKIKYENRLLTIIVEMFNGNMSLNQIINEINKPENEFNILFKKLNNGNKHLEKKSKGITKNNIDKMLKFFNYKNWRDFTDKITMYNHKIVKIEILETKMDVGTITIDGNELYNNHHTFALESGVFVYNSNLGDIADIEYLQRKLVTALRIPKPILGFDETAGEGKNLAMLDIRFARTINRIQQSIIQELNKIAIIHLYILGFHDELNEFTLSLTNPSTQGETLKIEQWKEKVALFKELVTVVEGGLAPTSHTWAKKNVFNWSENEIRLDLEQQRLERAAATELENTSEIIKKTGFFDKIDKLYGETKSKTEEDVVEEPKDGEENEFDGGGFGGGSIGGGGSFGGDFGDFGDEGGELDDEFAGEGEDFNIGDEENTDNLPPEEPGVGESFRNDTIDKLLTEGINRNEDIRYITNGIDDLLKNDIKDIKPIDDLEE